MKILKKGKGIKYPKHKKIRCNACGTKFVADFGDCYKSRSVLGSLNYYVVCPICNSSLYYCDYLGDEGLYEQKS